MASSEWWVYLVECADNTLYTGISTDVMRRVKEHNTSPRGARYTHSRRPVTLRYTEGPFTRQVAMRREREIKGFTRRDKQSLISTGAELKVELP